MAAFFWFFFGVGCATLHPKTGKTEFAFADVDGVKIAHIMVYAAQCRVKQLSVLKSTAMMLWLTISGCNVLTAVQMQAGGIAQLDMV